MNMGEFKYILDKLEEVDIDCYQHSERVAMLCYSFAKTLDIDTSERGVLYMAGFLHEIGKYQFENTMNINGTDIVLEEIYPLFSKAIIASRGYERLAKIVAQHRENIDGSGKPFGIIGDDIHLYATIVHICDFYDDCRIKDKLDHAHAMSKLRQESDVIFPKKLITPFLKMLANDDDMKEVYSRRKKHHE